MGIGEQDPYFRSVTHTLPTTVDRVYARTIAVTTRDNDAGAVEELLDFARRDAHVLGRVRDRVQLLQFERPWSDVSATALRLVTRAWISAIEAA